MDFTKESIINNEHNISSLRIWQIRKHINNAKENIRTNKANEIYFSALENIQQEIFNENKGKKKYVEKFTQWYLSKLTKNDIDNLRKQIQLAIDLTAHSYFIGKNWDKIDDNLYDIIAYPDNFKLSEVINQLLMNLVLLPHYENQKQFNKELSWIIKRINNFINIFFESDILLYPINKDVVYNYFETYEYLRPLYVSKHINHEFIKSVFLEIDFPSLAWEIDYTFYNNYVSFWFKVYINNLKANWNEIKEMFDNYKNFEKIDNWFYLVSVWESNNIKVFLQVWNIIFKKNIDNTYDKFVEISYKIEPNIATWWDDELVFLNDSLLLIDKLMPDLFSKIKDKLWWTSNKKYFVNFNDMISIWLDDDQFINDNQQEPTHFSNINFAKLWDVVDKLFLPERTKQWYDMLYKYLKDKNKLDNVLLKPLKWAIFYWPPWTWKTESIKKIAKDLKIDVIVLSIEDVLSKRVWESEARIRQVFDEYFTIIKKSDKPVILFIDEVDWFFGSRWNDWNWEFKDWIRSIILQQIEWFSDKNDLWKNWFIVISTNFIDKVDSALKRRLNFKLNFDLPDEKVRENYILHLITLFKKRGIFINKENIKDFVNLTEWLSQSIIRNAFDNAVILSWFQKKLSLEDIKKWIDYSKSSENTIWQKIWFIS